MLEIDLDDSLELVSSNRGQVSQILVNLAVNAADAMPDGGRLSISTRGRDAGPGGAGMSGTKGPWVLLMVADTGVGMTAETRARIFEPFYSTKGETHKGVGLGLATVYGIVTGLGGQLCVESEVGQGTCFEVWLPGCGESAKPGLVMADTSAEVGAARRILFVEDDDNVREVIVETLRHHGHAVVPAANGQEALEKVGSSDAATFDIIVTDAVMPGMSGPEMIRVLRAQLHSLPIVICSGYSEELSEPSVVSKLGVTLLSKPYAIEDLFTMIRDLTSKK